MVSGIEYGIFIIGGILCLLYGIAAGIISLFGKK